MRTLLNKVLAILPYGAGPVLLVWLLAALGWQLPDSVTDFATGGLVSTLVAFLGAWLTPEGRTKLEEYLASLLRRRPAEGRPLSGDGA